MSDVYGGSAICDGRKCDRELCGNDSFWHCSTVNIKAEILLIKLILIECYQKANSSNGEDVGYE